MSWNGKRVLVTGAGGFVGSHLAEALAESGADVRAFVHYNALGSRGLLEPSASVEVVQGDIRDPSSLRPAMTDVEIVYHLAALIAIPYSYIAPRSYIQTNVEGTLNVLEACREFRISRLVGTSTSEVYGSAQSASIDESHPLQAQSPYAASKIAADKLIESYHRSFDVPAVIVRPFNTYGPRQSARAIVPTIISQALVSDTVRLGNLSPTRDLSFVDDTVEAFLLAGLAEGVVGEQINVGTGQEISIGDLAEIIVRLAGRSVPVLSDETRIRPEKSEVTRLLADASRANRLLGWVPRTALEEGLQKTITWIHAHLDAYHPDQYAV
ncbi:MAG: NAD-dependent dehydratase [Gemmatimonadetes bacterium]|nr:NAD-dependent dehydratase [Gemmatimonadota bacterium]